MPYGYRTEHGACPDVAKIYGLEQDSSSSYVPRTHKNAANADVTLWWGNTKSPGYKCTLKGCTKANKPLVRINDLQPEEVVQLIITNNYRVLNIAGHRESGHPGIGNACYGFLLQVFNLLKNVSEEQASVARYTNSSKDSVAPTDHTKVDNVETIDWGEGTGFKTTITHMTSTVPLIQTGENEFSFGSWLHPILPASADVCSATNCMAIFSVEEEGLNSGVSYYFATDPKLVEIDHMTPGDSARECYVIICDIIPHNVFKVINDPSSENIEAFWVDYFSEVPILGHATTYEQKLYSMHSWAIDKVNELHQYVKFAYIQLSEVDFCEFYLEGLRAPMPYWMVTLFNLEYVAYSDVLPEDYLGVAPLDTHMSEAMLDSATTGPFYYEHVLGITSWGSFAYPRTMEEFGSPISIDFKSLINHFTSDLAQKNVNVLWNVITSQY